MKRRWLPIVCAPAVMIVVFAACGDDDVMVSPKPDSGGVVELETSVPDSAGGDGGVAEKLAPTVVAKFDPAQFELPEGIVVQAGTPIVGFAPQGRLVTVSPDGGYTQLAAFPAALANTYVVGLALDPQANVYAAVGAVGPSPSPTPGIYKVAGDGGTLARFDTAVADTFAFPNGLDFVGADLFVSDSSGKILKVAPDGTTTPWLVDAALAGDKAACNSQSPFPIGVNGITHDDAYLYGVNLDKGTFFRVKRDVDGGAGAVEVLLQTCDFFGADGIVRDANGTFVVANNPKSRIDRVTITGATATFTTIATGGPLDGPASLAIDGTGASRKLYITSSAFGSIAANPDAAAPSLLSAPLP